jgi:threonine dehydrogenase-like Zn-dependent dehydrogenase
MAATLLAGASGPSSRQSTAAMRAARLVAPGRMEICQAPRPTPQPNEILVRLEGCGVCASNLAPWEGKPWFQYPMAPGALGHEGWGRAEAVGEAVTGFAPGERVGILSQHAYAEFDVAPEDGVVRLPETLEWQPFPAEPLGCALNIFGRSQIEAGQTVAIVGIGFLGALLTQLATKAGARVIAISRRDFALALARRLGAGEIISSGDKHEVVERVRELTGGKLCEVVIEAVGKQDPLDLAGELTAERGRLVVAGYHQDGLRQINLQLWNWRGIDVINAHERDPAVYRHGIELAVEAVASGRLTPDLLYTHIFPLHELGNALRFTAERPDGFMKALIAP